MGDYIFVRAQLLKNYTSPQAEVGLALLRTPLLYNPAPVCEGAIHNGPNMLGLYLRVS